MAHKKSEKIFGCARKIKSLFFGKSIHAFSRKPELFSTAKKSHKTLKNTQFSDVNAIAGNQGYSQAVSAKKPPEIYIKKSDCQNSNKLQAQIPLKSVILDK